MLQPPPVNNPPTVPEIKSEENISDVDINIPATKSVNKDAIALIIGNQ
ncbi:MAG: hypothetical protein KTR26_15625 [Flammeovirgaceae bacterium]|nr:hypothetical protein [Flammeovirgaceae bacterium]